MNNHLIIGLGGTGGKIIRSFRKALYQEFRNEDPQGIHVAYLYVDSSDEMMDLNDPSWKVLGHSVQLGQNSQLKIGGADLHAILDNVRNYPGVEKWIGDRNQWKDILNSIVGETLGGQKRRLGRFLFANMVHQFNQRVKNLVNQLQDQSGTSAVTFHVISGLAGGTGGGSLVDVVAQIREMGFSDHQYYRTIVYALLPDENPPQNWDTGNYHANGYAALAELNALSVGAFKPHDITGRKDRLSAKEPFNGCYVFTNRNENGMKVDVDMVMPEIVADFLYQKIVAVKDLEDWPRQLQRMENAENGDGTPETAPGGKWPERSKRFLTFGIKRLAVPEEEILEYMTYSFTSQAALQILYNNWQDGFGFQAEPRIVDFKEQVQHSDLRSRWRLRDEHLCLSQGILEGDAANKKWKSIQNEWQEFINGAKILVRDSVDRPRWLDELENLCAKRYNEDYRTLGVPKFYETKLKARRDMAREIRRLVEGELFDEWRTGNRSMHEVSRLLEDLISDVEDRHRSADDRKTAYETREGEAADQLKGNRTKWADLGVIGKYVFRRQDNLLDAHAGHLQELYIYRTWQMGWGFAKKLLEELKEALNELKAEVDDTFSRIKQASDLFDAKLASRCNDEADPDLKQHLIRYYSPEKVRSVTERFVRDPAIQNNQTGGVRSLLVNKLGEQPGFRAFNKNISVIQFMDYLESECEKSAKRTHDVAIESAREKLLGVNVIERLKNQYGADNQELRSYIADLVKYAGNYVNFSEMEKNKRSEGIPVAPNRITEFTAILPRAPEHSDFMDRLKKTLKESRTDRVHTVETDTRPNELTLISITNLFPLRFLSPLATLQDKYRQRIQDLGKDRATLEIHLEGDGSQFPELFVETQAGVEEKGIPWILLAKATGLLAEREIKHSGARVLSVVTKDEDGFDNEPIDLGASLVEVPEHLTQGTVNLIREEVGKRIDGRAALTQDDRREVIRTINGEIEAIKASRGMDDEIYKRFLTGAKEAANLVKGEG